ncbi:MAG TPA: hypothetical protein VMH90_01845 [Thermoplasmata archaeon]|nr:hypothetical protein [Thermoplasmata archaeon]
MSRGSSRLGRHPNGAGVLLAVALSALLLLPTGVTVGAVVPGGAALPTHPAGADLYTASLFEVTFTESALPPGTSWNLSVGNRTWSSGASSLTIEEPNGTYSYHANATESTNQTSEELVSDGSFRVEGGPVTVGIVWQERSNAPEAGSSSNGAPALSTVLLATVAVGVLGLLAAAGATIGVHRRNRRRTHDKAAPVPPVAAGTPAETASSESPGPENDPLRHML